MSNITIVNNYKSFKKECRFFFCDNLYEGEWDGKERFIIASDTPENILKEKYPEIIEMLSPYLYCDSRCGEIFAESIKNINKFKKRRANTIGFGCIETIEDCLPIKETDFDRWMLIEEALSICTPIQRDRIKKYYLEKMTISEIAEGVASSTVWESINSGIKKMKKYFTDTRKNEGSYSLLSEEMIHDPDIDLSTEQKKGEK